MKVLHRHKTTTKDIAVGQLVRSAHLAEIGSLMAARDKAAEAILTIERAIHESRTI